MDIILNELKLRNFKGCKEADYVFDSKLTSVFGENEAGKTTIFDAFCFLLFGKDSLDRTDFDIKTLDVNNNPIHKASHSVEGIFTIGGRKQTFKREYLEKWVKPHGEPVEVFKGHETNYWVDGVPQSKAKDYTDTISQIISEKLFKLITNPYYFSNLHWEERRKIVLSIVKEPSDSEIAALKPEFERLLKQLDGRSIADTMKIIAAKKKAIKEQIADTPARIQEVQLQMPEAVNTAEIEKQIAECDTEIERLNKLTADQKAATDEYYAKYNTLKARANELKDNLDSLIRAEANNAANAKESQLSDLKLRISKLEGEIRLLNQNISSVDSSITDKQNSITIKKGQKDVLVQKYREVGARVFSIDKNKLACPTCQRPYEDSENIEQKLEENFNNEKNRELTEINTKGVELKTLIENLEKEKAVYETEKEIHLKALSISNTTLTELRKELAEKENSFITVPQAVKPEIEKAKAAYEAAETLVKEYGSGLQVGVTDYSAKIREVYEKKSALHSSLKNNEYIEKAKARITELTEAQRNLGIELADLEGIEYTADCFNKAKIEMMEADITEAFGGVKFKMFNQLISGGYEPCCETLIEGVPFLSANHAGQINTGIKIINTLTKANGITAPIFVDNAEAVNEVELTESQIIKLVVVEPDFVVGRISSENEILLTKNK